MINLTIKNQNRSNPRTVTLFGDSSLGYETCRPMSCGWKEGLGWGEEVKSEDGYVKQTINFMAVA